MISAFLGIILGFAITFYAFNNTSSSAQIFLDPTSLIIVLGGTISAAAITFSFSELKNIFLSIYRVFVREKHKPEDIIKEIVQFSNEVSQTDQFSNAFLKFKDEVKHPFLRDGLALIENKFDREQIYEIMTAAIQERKESMLQDVSIIKTLAKYPPAFGMIGTVIGLVGLLQGLAVSNGVLSIGKDMAIALITTLYGLLFSNYIFLPMSENIYNKTKHDILVRKIILKGVLLIYDKEDSIYIQESLNSHIHPKKRIDMFLDNQEQKAA